MPKKTKPHYNIVTVGSAVRDMVFYTKDAELIRNPKLDPTKQKLIAFEYGAKIHSDNVRSMFGGGAANTAITCARLGLRVGTLLRVGCGEAGDEISDTLRHEGVDTTFIEHDGEHDTGLSFLVVETKTNEHVVFVNYGANEYLNITTTVLKSFTTDWFYVPSLNMKHWSKTLENIVNAKSKIAWNPGEMQLRNTGAMKKLLPKVQVVIVNKDEAIELSLATGFRTKSFVIKKLVEHIFSLGVSVVVITDGRAGAYVYDGVTLYFDKPSQVKPKDTTGAGDAFGATFITGLIRRPNDFKFALRLATLNATAQVAVVGAQEGLLTWKQITQRI